MAKEKRLHRVTFYINRDTQEVERKEVEAEVRDDTDEDLGEWQNISREYDDLKPAVKTAIKTKIIDSMN